MITLQNWQVLVEKSHDISMFLRDPLTDKKNPTAITEISGISESWALCIKILSEPSQTLKMEVFCEDS